MNIYRLNNGNLWLNGLSEFEKLNGVSVNIPSEPKDLTLFGLTLDEAKDWIQGEPDFNRRIVTPLGSRREGTTACKTTQEHSSHLKTFTQLLAALQGLTILSVPSRLLTM